MKTKIINIFSGPGVGKSTMAAGIFYELKMAGVDCELALEYAKDKVWEESYKTLDNQLYITAKQYHRIKRLEGKVEIVVTDSPILLGLHYGKNDSNEFRNLIIHLHNEFESFNIFLNRIHKYNPNGRMQTEEEAIKIDESLLKIVSTYCDDINFVDPNRESLLLIINQLLSK